MNKMICLILIFLSTHLSASSNQRLIYRYCESGFFAIFSGILGALEMYETEGFSGIHVDLCGGMYRDPSYGPNWWEYFFEPIDIGDKTKPFKMFSLKDYLDLTGRGFWMDRDVAHTLIKKYVHLKPAIQKKVDLYVRQHFEEHFLIGIHHRGTDKSLEIPIVSYEKTTNAIDAFVSQLTGEQKNKLKFYIATDDANFIDYMISYYGRKLLLFNDFVRSSNDHPIHHGNNELYRTIYQKGEEALIDCLLLSRCHVLIRPRSSLSWIAEKFNPELCSIVLE